MTCPVGSSSRLARTDDTRAAGAKSEVAASDQPGFKPKDDQRSVSSSVERLRRHLQPQSLPVPTCPVPRFNVRSVLGKDVRRVFGESCPWVRRFHRDSYQAFLT